MAALVKRECVVELPILGEKRSACAGFGRKEAGEEKSVAGQAAGAEHGGDGAGTGHGHDRQTDAAAGAHHTETGVADCRGAGVGNDGDGLALAEADDELIGDDGLVVVVVGQEGTVQAEAGE